MKPYPVRVPREGYRGRDPKRLAKVVEHNRVAAKIESYLNADLETKPDNSIQSYFSHSISSEVREDYAVVQRIVFSIDCGHNGVTIYKGDYELAMKGLTASQSAT